MSNFLVKNGDKAEWGYPEGYPWKEETLGINIEWDGNTEGLYCVDDQYYLISNEVPNIELIKKGILNFSGSVYNMIDLWAQMEQYGNITDSFILGPETMIIFIKKPNIVIENIVFEKVGIYFKKTANHGYTKSFTIPDVKTIYPIAAEFLPDGYPYKENSKIVIEWDGNIDDKLVVGDMYYKVSDAILDYKTIKNSIVYIQHSYGIEKVAMEKFWNTAHITDEIVVAFQGIIFVKVDNVEYGGLTYPEAGVYFLKTDSDCVIKFSSSIETIHPMSEEFLPYATTTTTGTVKQAATVADVTAAPTAQEFNALLKSLRDAGILATE